MIPAVLGQAYFLTFLARDLSQQVRNGRRIDVDRFSARTVDSGSISHHFWCFGPDLKIRAGPKLGLWPDFQVRAGPRLGPGPPTRPADSRTFFLGPIPELFFCTFFVAFPGNSSNNVDPADPMKFVAFPGNSTNNVDKNPDLAFLEKVPEWGPEKSSGICRPGWV